MTTYLIRIIIPINRSVAGFLTISYLPQDLSFFVLGTAAFCRNWFRNIPRSMEKVGFILALVATITLFPLALTRGTDFFGSGLWQSAVYAPWDSTVTVGMTFGLIKLFRKRFNWSGSFSRFLHRHSYALFVIEASIIVFVAVALMGLSRAPAQVPSVSVDYGSALLWAAYMVLKIPFASRVL